MPGLIQQRDDQPARTSDGATVDAVRPDNATRLRHLSRLTWPVAVLSVAASLAGIGWAGTYVREVGAVRPALVAQDAFNLIVAVPLLILAARGVRSGSFKAALVWLGTLAYMLYSYAVYAFNVQHNPLFLVYTALLAITTYGVIAGASSMPRSPLMKPLAPTTERWAGGFMVVVGALFTLVWLVDIGVSLASGRPPAITERYRVPTFAPYVLDLGFALPALIIGGVRLFLHQPLGRLLGGIMLPMVALMMLQLGTGTAYQGTVTGPMEWGLLYLFNGLAIAGALVTEWLWRKAWPAALSPTEVACSPRIGY